LAYTVEDAIAAVTSAQAAETNINTIWFLQASVTIADTPPEQLYAHPGAEVPTPAPEGGPVELDVPEEAWAPITGNGPLFRGSPTPLLGNLNTPLWDADKFRCQRGGGPPFYLGLEIEPVITVVGPLSIRPPVFARSFVQRHRLLSRKHYRGIWALQPQLRFSVALTEDPVNPKLTGTITPDPSLPGTIHPPATIEVVLESLSSATIL
jgi:hypothetical protein